MILNQSQARAVYDAMAALNNVGGLMDVRFEDSRVTERKIGGIWVYESIAGDWEPAEHFADQHDFAATYGLA